jgi:hypothetical protein
MMVIQAELNGFADEIHLSSHTLDRDWSEKGSTQHGHEEPRDE